MSGELARQMARHVPGITGEVVFEKLDPAWNEALTRIIAAQQAQEQADAGASAAALAVEDVDAQAARLLREMAIRVRRQAERMLKSRDLMAPNLSVRFPRFFAFSPDGAPSPAWPASPGGGPVPTAAEAAV